MEQQNTPTKVQHDSQGSDHTVTDPMEGLEPAPDLGGTPPPAQEAFANLSREDLNFALVDAPCHPHLHVRHHRPGRSSQRMGRGSAQHGEWVLPGALPAVTRLRHASVRG